MEAGCISGQVAWSVHHPYPSFWFLPQCLTPNFPYSQMSPFSSPGLNPSLCSSPLLRRSMLELPVSVMIWDLIFFILIGVRKSGARGRRCFHFRKMFDAGCSKSRAYRVCKADTMSWNTGGARSPVRRVGSWWLGLWVPLCMVCWWMKNICSESQWGKDAAELGKQIPIKAVIKVWHTSSSGPGTKQKWDWSNDIFQYEAEERQIILG